MGSFENVRVWPALQPRRNLERRSAISLLTPFSAAVPKAFLSALRCIVRLIDFIVAVTHPRSIRGKPILRRDSMAAHPEQPQMIAVPCRHRS